jgi:hypothetical protein
VKHLAVKDERGNRLDPGTLGVADAGPLLAQVNDIDGVARRVERVRELPLGGDTNRTTRVIESGDLL